MLIIQCCSATAKHHIISQCPQPTGKTTKEILNSNKSKKFQNFYSVSVTFNIHVFIMFIIVEEIIFKELKIIS